MVLFKFLHVIVRTPNVIRAKAQERDRTADLVLTKDVLYRLSYLGIPVNGREQSRPPAITIIRKLERETGLEPATPSLEGSRSTN
jgi:hypothetical protein